MPYSESQKRATIKYLSKLKDVRLRVTPEEYEEYDQARERCGYPSMRSFIMAAILEKIARMEQGQD